MGESRVTYPQCLLGIVLPRHDEDLEAFPTERRHLLDHGIHVFLEVVSADDGVDLELDGVFGTELAELDKGLEVFAPPTTDLDVGGLVEGIAGYSHDIERIGVFLKPVFRDFAAVCDNGHGLHGQIIFAVPVSGRGTNQ